MTIEYKNKHLNISLLYALFFIVVLVPTSFSMSDNWMIIIGILTPTSFVVKYFYQKKHNYLTITDNSISLNDLFLRKLELTEIKSIEKYAGNYILKTDKKTLTIDTTIIEPNSLITLNAALEKLKVEWD